MKKLLTAFGRLRMSQPFLKNNTLLLDPFPSPTNATEAIDKNHARISPWPWPRFSATSNELNEFWILHGLLKYPNRKLKRMFWKWLSLSKTPFWGPHWVGGTNCHLISCCFGISRSNKMEGFKRLFQKKNLSLKIFHPFPFSQRLLKLWKSPSKSLPDFYGLLSFSFKTKCSTELANNTVKTNILAVVFFWSR